MKRILKMLTVFIKDKSKLKGWEQNNIFNKVKILLAVIWTERIKIYKIIIRKYIYIRQVELVLTTKCSLHCEECANLMPYYKQPYDVSEELLYASIEKIINKVDEIGDFVLVGGEPFLFHNIHMIINKIVTYSKVIKIKIFTNGTIMPNRSELILELKKQKVEIIISDYGKISSKKFLLVDLCKKENIKCHLKSEDLEWGLVGKPEFRGRNHKDLKKQFRKCNNYCRSILNGKLFYCPRAAHSFDLDIIEDNEYVDLIDEKVETEEIVNLIYSKHYFTACNYCNYGTSSMISIVPGKQIER